MPYKDLTSPEAIESARRARRKHYYANKEQYYERNKKAALEKREYIKSCKDVPCLDCGKKYEYYVMDFDHVKGEKLKRVSAMVKSTWKQLKDEISKCEVVCANCHRQRTYKRQQHKS